MSYVLTDGTTTVVAYPYNTGMLRRDNPNVSFPSSMTDAQLSSFNVFNVSETEPPAYDGLTETLTEIDPTTPDGGVTWNQAWQVASLPAEDIETFYDAAVAKVNAEVKVLKDALQTFYTESLIIGYGFNAEMNAYVEALDNPTALPNYPLVTEWPTLPENKFDMTNTELPINAYSKEKMNEVLTGALTPLSQQLSAVVSEEILGGFEEALL